jgi:hypothetical protein
MNIVVTTDTVQKYSQYEEQTWILKAVGGLPSNEAKFLDIGAWNPTTFSNTRALYELGWQGVLIEPAPGPVIVILMTCSNCGYSPESENGQWGKRKRESCDRCGSTVFYGNDPRITLIQAAMGFEQGSLMPIQVTDDAVSTSSDSNYRNWKEAGGFYGQVQVPQITWKAVFNQFGKFDFVNIDAEGISVDLFDHLMNQTQARPRCICLEHDNRIVEAVQHGQSQGYVQTHINGTNLILVRP